MSDSSTEVAPAPVATLNTLLADHLAAHATRTAFVDGGATLSYAQFDALAEGAARWLEEHGIGAGDRVAVWLVNRIEWLALLFGAARIGATVVAVNTRYRRAELEHILGKSQAKLLVFQPNFRKIDFPAELAGIDAHAVASLRKIAVIDADASTPEALIGKPVVHCAFEPATAPRRRRPGETAEAPLILFTTSGTTKAPKLVVHPQRTITGHSQRAARAYGFDAHDAVMLAALPFCGVFGLNGALAAFAGGAPVVLIDTFDAREAARLVQAHRVTHTFGSDEMYRRLLEAGEGERPFPSARVFGFAAFQPGLASFAAYAQTRGMPLTGLYGSSEVQALFSCQKIDMPFDTRIEGGGYPAAGELATIRIRDIESGKLLPHGESGEIEIAAPGNFLHYLDNADATAEALTPDGFFRTGDIGFLREDGSFVYQTRKGDAIRLAGFLVSPVEIEDEIKAIEGVDDAQIVAVEIDGQQRAVAFVIAAAQPGLNAESVRHALAGRMAAFKVPARVWFVDAFPVTQSSNGVKIQRARLRDMAVERVQGETV
ncbi:AMP-binding protein [Paraburkholderia acidisoli]|uniref:Long-chain-fatty-acid--CoA ligase n=1 Tax=Paraburkholderia acidisoli TaxID=2571748 RepID=A0A7Z2GJP5_9BURK|nr:AMP-binding protein [Paraburkholderia acidisoli]QGZ63047.1 AMP-binding protein [Paraburkholderia acidisoli]